jgi:hypothetical protein
MRNAMMTIGIYGMEMGWILPWMRLGRIAP